MADVTKRVLVTGSTGFVGANLVRRLLSQGHEVHLLVRPRDTRWRLQNIISEVVLHECVLQDAQRVTEVVTSIDPQWVFHLAAYGAYSSQRNVHDIVSTNYNGTINLVEACLQTGFESFVNAGSSSEYGYVDHAPVETELPQPNSHYAATKVGATLYCNYAAQAHRRHIVTLRLYSVFGAWEDPTRLLPTLLVRGMRGELPPLVSPTIARDYVYIDDVTDAFLAAAQSQFNAKESVFNVGTGIQTSLAELVEMVRRQLGVVAEPEWGSMPNRQWDTDVWVSDPSAIARTLGWTATYSLAEGLVGFADWIQSDHAIRDYYETHRTPPQ